MCLLESAVCALYDCLNAVFVDGVLYELLFNQFLRDLCITMCLRVKERYRVIKR